MVIKKQFIVRVGGAVIECPSRQEAIRTALELEKAAVRKPDSRHLPPPKQAERALAEEVLRILAEEGQAGVESNVLASRLDLDNPRRLGRIALAIKHFLAIEGISRDQAYTTERDGPRGPRIWKRGPKIMEAIHILNSAAQN
jgi:hypothetical protein